jgi:hypothetical protein
MVDNNWSLEKAGLGIVTPPSCDRHAVYGQREWGKAMRRKPGILELSENEFLQRITRIEADTVGGGSRSAGTRGRTPWMYCVSFAGDLW